MIAGIRASAGASYAAPMSARRTARALRVASIASAAALVAACAPQPVAPALPPPEPSALALHARPAAATLAVSERRTLRAFFADGAELVGSIPLGPAATIDDPEIAELEGEAIVGLAPGSTTLHLVHDAAPLAGATDVPIVVTAAGKAALSIEPVARPHIGEPIAVRALLRYDDGTTADVTYDAAWSTPTPGRLHTSDDPLQRGSVVALGPKPATLVARLDALEASTEIVPLDGEPTLLEVRLVWGFGERRRFGAFAQFADGARREVSGGCLWRVDGGAPFRGLDRPQRGPWVRRDELAWDRIATCELSTSRATGVLFGE